LLNRYTSLSISRLIETWDVLKSGEFTPDDVYVKINRNMGCIEIVIRNRRYFLLGGLIETWDVLKCVQKHSAKLNGNRLIETWDVLKFASPFRIFTCFGMINRNMGCIEMFSFQGGFICPLDD